jgi:hypothetical protein
MAGKRLSMNIYISRPAIMASKNATGTSMNVRKQNDSITHELLRAMKNVKEWKFVEGENKLEYSWFVKDKKGNNGDHMYLYCAELDMYKEIIRHLACYEIYVSCQPHILFMHLSNKAELISSLYIVSN